jgi:selenocysteine-specific elongation factor
MVRDAGLPGVAPDEAARRSSLDTEQIEAEAVNRGWFQLADRIVDDAQIEAAVDRTVEALSSFHQSHPLRRGLSSEELASRHNLPAGGSVIEAVLNRAMESGQIERDPPFWRQSGFRVEFEGPLKEAVSGIISDAEARDIMPLSQSELEELVSSQLSKSGAGQGNPAELIDALVHQEELIRYPGGFFQSGKGHRKLITLIRGHFDGNDTLSVPEFRDLTGGLTRKYVIPILEFMDADGITTREGDVRLPGSSLR